MTLRFSRNSGLFLNGRYFLSFLFLRFNRSFCLYGGLRFFLCCGLLDIDMTHNLECCVLQLFVAGRHGARLLFFGVSLFLGFGFVGSLSLLAAFVVHLGAHLTLFVGMFLERLVFLELLAKDVILLVGDAHVRIVRFEVLELLFKKFRQCFDTYIKFFGYFA